MHMRSHACEDAMPWFLAVPGWQSCLAAPRLVYATNTRVHAHMPAYMSTHKRRQGCGVCAHLRHINTHAIHVNTRNTHIGTHVHTCAPPRDAMFARILTISTHISTHMSARTSAHMFIHKRRQGMQCSCTSLAGQHTRQYTHQHTCQHTCLYTSVARDTALARIFGISTPMSTQMSTHTCPRTCPYIGVAKDAAFARIFGKDSAVQAAGKVVKEVKKVVPEHPSFHVYTHVYTHVSAHVYNGG